MSPSSYQSSCNVTKKSPINRDIQNDLKIQINSLAYYYVFKDVCSLLMYRLNDVSDYYSLWSWSQFFLTSLFSSFSFPHFHLLLCSMVLCPSGRENRDLIVLNCDSPSNLATDFSLWPAHTHDATVEMYSQPGVCSTDLTPCACIS